MELLVHGFLYVWENIMYLTRELDWAGEDVELNRASYLISATNGITSSIGGPSLSFSVQDK